MHVFSSPSARHRCTTLGVLLAAVVAIGGCSSDDPAPDASESAVQDPTGTDAPTADDGASAAPVETAAADEPLVVEVDLEARNVEGMTIRVDRLEAHGDTITTDVEIVVPADLAISWLNHADEPAIARDDLGNEYPLVPPEDNTSLELDAGERLEGRLQWQGPLADEASTLTLLFNESRDPEGGTVNDRVRPHVTLGPIDLAGGTSATADGGVEPVEVDLDLEARTASGATFRLHRLEVTDLAIEADVEVTIPDGHGNAYLSNVIGGRAVARDDLGNDYPVLEPDDNGSLEIDEGEALEGTLVFQGPVLDGATSLTLLFNQDNDPEGTALHDRLNPHFTLGPIGISS